MERAGQFAAMGRALRADWTGGRWIDRFGYIVGAALFVAGLFHFSAFGLPLIAVVWTSHRLTMSAVLRQVTLTLFAMACVADAALTASTVDSKITMAAKLVLVTAALVLTVAASLTTEQPPALRLTLRLGYVALLTGALLTASSTHGSWVLTHAVLVLPALAWSLGFSRWTELAALRVVQIGAAGYLGLVFGIDWLTGLGLALLTVAVALTAYSVLNFPTRAVPRSGDV